MVEKDFYADVQAWLKKNIHTTVVVELKLVKGNRFSFSDVPPHQVHSLAASKHRKFSYKIPDVGYDRKPFDMFMLSGCLAFVGVIFYVPHKKRHLYLIDIDVFIRRSEREDKSLTEEDCLSLCEYDSVI